MLKSMGVLAALVVIFAAADVIRGQNNGDAHRFYIHIAKFIFLFGFLCLLEAWLFFKATTTWNINRWIIVIVNSIVTGVMGMVLFAVSDGSFHGDGGPIATSFLILSAVGELGLIVGIVGFLVNAIVRKNAGFRVLSR